MKNSTVSLSFDEEKLSAVRRYMQKKNTHLEKELTVQLEKLYQKYVPATVQEYISARDSEIAPATPKGKNGVE